MNSFFSIRSLLAGILLLGVAGCGHDPVAPSAGPTAALPDVRLVISSLSGVVTEQTAAGLVPVEGVTVEEMSCGGPISPCPIQKSQTDKNGFYSFTALTAGQNNNILWIWKDGSFDPFPPRPEASEGGVFVLVNSDSRFDVQLVRR